MNDYKRKRALVIHVISFRYLYRINAILINEKNKREILKNDSVNASMCTHLSFFLLGAHFSLSPFISSFFLSFVISIFIKLNEW